MKIEDFDVIETSSVKSLDTEIRHDKALPRVEYAVDLQNVSKNFGSQQAVKNLSIKVPRGSIYGLLGPNGAGKTTTIRMMLGITDPDSGTRSILGHKNPANVARTLGYLPEERGLYANMKACDVIAYMATLRGMPRKLAKEKGIEMLEEYGMGESSRKTIRQLSKGMAQTVQIIGTLVHSPQLVVLDEPFSGLDALNQERLEELIRNIASKGSTVIFSTHVIAHAERLCEQVGIIARGTVRFSGSVEDALDLMPSSVLIETRRCEGKWTSYLPSDAVALQTQNGTYRWHVPLNTKNERYTEDLLSALVRENAGVIAMSIQKATLHDTFMHIAREASTNKDSN